MTTVATNRPLAAAAKAPAPIQVAAPVAAPAPATSGFKLADWWVNRNALDVVRTGAAVGQAAGRIAVTPPVIVDIAKGSLRSAVSLTNMAWQIIPSAISNVRSVFAGRISAGRGAANIATDTTLGIAKGISSGILVQSLSVATGPLIGLLPLSPTLLPFVGMAVGLLGLGASYLLMNKLIKSTHVDAKLSNALTTLFGGDKPAA